MWLVYGALAIVLYIVYSWIIAIRRTHKIVLIEKDDSKPKHLMQLGNPLLTFPKMVYQSVLLKTTEFERTKKLKELNPPLQTGTSRYLLLFVMKNIFI